MEFKGRPAATPQGVLARLWRKIIEENGLEHNLGYLVTRYVERTGESSKNIRRKTRSSIEADITSNELSWKKFTHIIFCYLGAVRVDLTVKLTFATGKTSVHTVGLKSSDSKAVSKDIDDNKGVK